MTTQIERIKPCTQAYCDGTILKETRAVFAVPASELRMGGGANPTKTIITCHCDTCGVMYKPEIVCP